MKKTLNLFLAYSAHRKTRKPKKVGQNYLMILLVMVIVVAGYGFWINHNINKTEASIAEMESVLADPTNQDILDKSKQWHQSLSDLQQLRGALTEVDAVFELKRSVTGAMVQEIMKQVPSTITITAIEFKPLAIQLSLLGTNNDAPAAFAKTLESLAFVMDVDYRGYSKSQDGYVAVINLSLKGVD